MANDVAQQVEAVRKSLQNLSNDALALRRSMGSKRTPPEQWETWRDALACILANVKRCIANGKYVTNEEDLLPWIVQRIEGLNLEREEN
jgi:hypothetical protein